MKQNYTLFNKKQIFQQIKEDLIGKDSFRGFSLSYSWIANQFGHFSLGFILTLFTYAIITFFNIKIELNRAINIATLTIGIASTLFEFFNLIIPIFSNKTYKTILPIFEKGKPRIFKPDWKNLSSDTFTDVCYFWLGALICNFFIKLTKLDRPNFIDGSNLFHFIILIIIIILLKIILFFLSYFWYTLRMNLQSASLPKQFRLAQWSEIINPEDIKTIATYVKQYKDNDHLILAGYDKSGKTNLAIALGNEMAFKFKKVYYANFMQFLSKLHSCDRSINKYWSMENTDLIIIDDINIGRPYFKDFIDPLRFFYIINAAKHHDFLKTKKIIWVLGVKNKNDISKWEKHIKDFYNNNIIIKSIFLDYLDNGNN